jgi:asparagine synthase (glutamine-hydrolysing)
VEARFPFLDYRVMEFANRLPPNLKLRRLTEKYLLRRLGAKILPKEISQRPKRPYRAPIHRSFFNPKAGDYVMELLSENELREPGFFDPVAVRQLVSRIQEGRTVGETEDMALVGILSTQILHRRFAKEFRCAPPLCERDDVRVCRSSQFIDKRKLARF